MSKRVRGPVRTHRKPGTRATSERGRARRPASLAQASPRQVEIAEVVGEDIVEDKPAAPTDLERASRAVPHARHHKIKAGSLLAARAATEYVYVSQDLRRILYVASGLVAVLLLLWLLIVALKVIPLPFY